MIYKTPICDYVGFVAVGYFAVNRLIV